jgi:hypothetical protein
VKNTIFYNKNTDKDQNQEMHFRCMKKMTSRYRFRNHTELVVFIVIRYNNAIDIIYQ